MADEPSPCATPAPTIPYHPLNQNEIRLLTLEPPSSSSDDTRIRCHLSHISLFDLNNDFAALSYHWGLHDTIKRIQLDDDLVPIPFNLYKALEELRRRGIYRVWADGLCINQRDVEEKSRQVLRMGAIYRAASLVFAHLRGAGTAHQECFAGAVERIVEGCEVPKREGKKVRRRRSSVKMHGALDAGSSPMRNDTPSETGVLSAAEETALFLFLDNPYWRRAWIVQEIAMNPKLVIVWGRQAFELNQVIQALMELGTYIGAKREKTWSHIKRIYKIRSAQLALKPVSLVEALGMCYLAKTCVDRDHVFGLLGLAHDGGYLVPVPSYTVPQDEINKDMTIRLVRATASLDIVVFKAHGVETWYPNWFDPRFWHAYCFSGLHEGKMGLLAHTNYGTYCASGTQTPSFRIEGMGMVAGGFFLGTIAECAPTLDETKGSGDEVQVSKSWRRNSKSEKMPLAPEQAGIMRTLCWLLVDITKPKVKGHRRTGEHLYTLLYRIAHEKNLAERVPALIQWFNSCEAQNFKIHEKHLAAYFSMKTSSPLSATEREALEDDCRFMQKNLRANMRLGWTNEGHIGWFHENAKAGDRVAVLLGSRMPCVLREREDGGYMVVGQCIVEGVMKGEALKEGLSRLHDIQLH